MSIQFLFGKHDRKDNKKWRFDRLIAQPETLKFETLKFEILKFEILTMSVKTSLANKSRKNRLFIDNLCRQIAVEITLPFDKRGTTWYDVLTPSYCSRIHGKPEFVTAAKTGCVYRPATAVLSKTEINAISEFIATTPIRHNGLEGNPALTGQVFTDNHAYFAKCSKTQQKKLTHYIGDKILRNESKQSLRKIQGSTVVIDKQGEKIEVLFDSKTTSHLSNDIAQSLQFIWNEFASKLPQILSKSNLIGREINVKRDKKPWAEEYFYYEYKTQYNTLYFSIEYNNNPLKNRQFYRLYSITSRLRDTAITY